ncbi:MAG: AAA family ATPase [Minicystis sp.]
MPYITRIQIEQCRNVRDLDIDLSVPAAEEPAGLGSVPHPKFRHLILTGPNGSGKSGVLQEVAGLVEDLLYPPTQGPQAIGRLLTVSFQPGTVKNPNRSAVRWSAGLRPQDVTGEGGVIGYTFRATATPDDLVVAYLPARRRIHLQKVAGPSKIDWKPNTIKPTTEASERLLQFLVNKRTEQALAGEDQDTIAVERIRDWFSAFEGHIRRLVEDEGLTLDFDRRAFDFRFRRSDGYTFDLNTLADGHAAVLAVLAELLIRVDVIRESRKDYSFIPEGVVIIDEIETHLHLSLQEQILPFLTELFPTFQFIVATHSPAVIASIPNAVVYDLRKRTQVLSDAFRGVRYGTLMTEHFGISSEIDLDSTEKLLRLRDLARRPQRSPDEERAFADLAALLSARSPALAVEVWMVKEGLGQPAGAAAGEKR